mmetsp:Transcript_3463/g.7192  ORF Transcript_3463/g.7192 Transcript_3463/m.7192 type:complete len:99 (-) Transcript_3463:2004-2300(-)
MVYFSIVNPIIEELFWRVFLAQSLPTFVVSACYAAYHVLVVYKFAGALRAVIAFPCLAILGLAFQIIKTRFGLVTAISVHSALDASAMLAWGLILTLL